MNFLPTQLGALTALTGNWTQTQLPRKQWCNHYTMNTWFVPSYIWFIALTLCMVLKHGECKILYYLFWCTWEFQMDSRWWRWHMQLFGWHSWTWLWTKNKLFDFINQLNEWLIICFFFQQVSAVFGCSSSVCPFAHQDAKYLSEVCSSRTSCAHPQVNGTNQRKTLLYGPNPITTRSSAKSVEEALVETLLWAEFRPWQPFMACLISGKYWTYLKNHTTLTVQYNGW